ncbi:hypothetical protein GCM10011502_30250 [Oceanisphaera marina]|uniref:Uncharacterized protein n=1 Tax=Oceanisphaera marina TaxID=2017550 RepID=A0ABQ1J1T3_9GAMM|nr:hypothetical protein [Oceanisphaera marina]GGB55245.1 hypothetical protein GCM10011502_30250 [Oceanisphaera marina]
MQVAKADQETIIPLLSVKALRVNSYDKTPSLTVPILDEARRMFNEMPN